jgi:hypothetical protein
VAKRANGSSNNKDSIAGLILESKEGLIIEVSLQFSFSTTNNLAEYETCIAGVDLALEMGGKTPKAEDGLQVGSNTNQRRSPSQGTVHTEILIHTQTQSGIGEE